MKINKDIRINLEGNRLETKGSLGTLNFRDMSNNKMRN
jgi:hypothetical protein